MLDKICQYVAGFVLLVAAGYVVGYGLHALMASAVRSVQCQ